MSGVSSYLCQAPNCGKAAKFQCPKCISLQLPKISSFYCSQDCFKQDWASHKKLHSAVTASVEANTASSNEIYPNFAYTGPLRPFPQSQRRTVPASIQRPDYADDGIPKSEMKNRGSTQIEVMSPEDIHKLRKVCQLARQVLDIAAAMVKPGVTTDEIDLVVHEACIARNSYPSPLNYHNFPKSCCTSVNEVICHGIPDMRPLQDGDIVNIDITLYHDGFHGDLNETFFVGHASTAAQKLVQVSHECMEKAILACKPGMLYREIGNIISKHASNHGLAVVRSYCGHGIHRLFHTAPNVPHYAKNKAVGVMKPGHCFTIEPMISEGTCWDETWPDNWTAVTRDGKLSSQFEHTLIITETGCEVLTRRTISESRHVGVPFFEDQLKTFSSTL